MSDSLTAEGYTVTSISNAKELSKKTIIYDYSGGKMKNTIKFLEDSLGVSAIQKLDSTKKVDISVVIGDDYKGISIKK